MKTTLHILVLLLLVGGATKSTAQAPQAQTEWRQVCDSLVGAAKAGDPMTDFSMMRIAYAKSDYYEPYEGLLTFWRDSMKYCAGIGDYQRSLYWVEMAEIDNYPDLCTQYYATVANEQQGNERQAAHHRWMTYYLAQAIMAGGDGNSDSTAWALIDVQEEHALISFLKYTEEPGAETYHLTTPYGTIDQVAATSDSTGERRVFYFNVDYPMAWLKQHPDVRDPDDPDSFWKWLDEDSSSTPEDSAFLDSLMNDTL